MIHAHCLILPTTTKQRGTQPGGDLLLRLTYLIHHALCECRREHERKGNPKHLNNPTASCKQP